MKDNCIIVDIDGTLANVDHRRGYLGKEGGWKKFNESMRLDVPNKWCVEIVNHMRKKYKIVLVTGRSRDQWSITIDWLRENGIAYHDIFFRRCGDYRQDVEVKAEILNDLIIPNFDVLFVIDDRISVVNMWRRAGLVCLQCDVGNF